MTIRIRALAHHGTAVPKQRQSLYKNAFSHLNRAITEGFYIEAITIVESLLSDRLESRASFLAAKNVGFQNLGKLVKEYIAKTETDAVLKALVLNDVLKWARGRNRAIHEMAKIEDGKYNSWDDRLAEAQKYAVDGMALLRKIDNRIKQLRRKKI